jgi:hypothetical protein
MGSTTGPPMTLEKARRQLEFINLLSVLYGNGLSTSVPCPPDLFASVIRANHLRSLTKWANSSQKDTHPAVLEILNQIGSFSPENWAAEVVFAQNPDVTDVTTSSKWSDDESAICGDQTPSFSGWLCLANAYQCAVALYCIVSLCDAEYSEECDTAGIGCFSSIRTSYLRALRQSLSEIAENNHQLGKLVLWPLVIAGLEIHANDESSKFLIRHQLKSASVSLGTSSPLVAEELLVRLWSCRDGSSCGSRRRWDDIFDKPYVFVI